MKAYMALLVGGPMDGELRAQYGYQRLIEYNSLPVSMSIPFDGVPEQIEYVKDCYWHAPIGGGDRVLIYRHETIGEHDVLERMARYYSPPKKKVER